ncbi:MAG: hypothetical protein HKO81_02370 [Flavobacteriaceae bacterium]|nr:hypothetical protein [Flavobacteriaceae bacterium]
MKTLSLIKQIYLQGFQDLGNHFVKSYFKIFAWFGFAMYGIVVYAFLFRVSTGFAFD